MTKVATKFQVFYGLCQKLRWYCVRLNVLQILALDGSGDKCISFDKHILDVFVRYSFIHSPGIHSVKPSSFHYAQGTFTAWTIAISFILVIGNV